MMSTSCVSNRWRHCCRYYGRADQVGTGIYFRPRVGGFLARPPSPCFLQEWLQGTPKEPRPPRFLVLNIEWKIPDFDLNRMFLCFLTTQKKVSARDHHDRNGVFPSMRRTEASLAAGELGLCGSRSRHRNMEKIAGL